MNAHTRSGVLSLLAVAILAMPVVGCSDDQAGNGDPDNGMLSDADVVGDADGTTDTEPDGDEDTTPPDAVGDVGDSQDVAVPDVPPDEGPDDVPVDVEPDVPEEPSGFESEDLVVKIVQPTGGRTAATLGSNTTVGGLLFGDADTITWQSSYNNLSGEIDEAPFWRSGQIQLTYGDNVITVTATKGNKTVSDTITITYNPAFGFDGDLKARPNIVWTGGGSSPVVFNVSLGLYANFNPSTVTLVEVDEYGNTVSTVGSMVDNGNVSSSGDEIQGDGVFSSKTSISCSGAGTRYYRASVDVTEPTAYKAWTPSIRIQCLDHYTSSDCNADKAVIDQASSQLTGGTSQADVIASLQANAAVEDAGAASSGGYGIWVQFKSGVLGAVMANPVGTRGAGANPPSPPDPTSAPIVGANVHEVGSRTAMVLAPFYGEFASTDDAPDVAAALSTSECPNFALESNAALQGPMASLDRFRSMTKYGITSISSHGDALFEDLDPAVQSDLYQWDHVGTQEVLWSGEPVTCGALLQTSQSCTVTSGNPNGGCPTGTQCIVTEGSGGSSSSGKCLDRTQADLRMGRVILTNKGYAMTPSFFEEYAKTPYPDSWVNLGACRTMYNGTLAGTIFGMGAKTVTGFSGYVDSAWAKERVVETFQGSVGKGQVGSFHTGGEDPSNAGSQWRLLGAGNLDLSQAEIINASFEKGDITGWRRDGDGRVISQLGSSIPVHGKFMSLISTGLGFTVQTGTLEQDFCIPADKKTVSVYWKFFSEEFKEYCGSQFQDTFQAVLLGSAGQLTVVDLSIDDLCGYGDGSCGSCPNPKPCSVNCMGTTGCVFNEDTFTCTDSYPCECGKYFVGLTPSDVQFDQGGVYNVLWQKTTKNVQALAGQGKVTLRLYASDTGDSIFDTVILMDNIAFE